MFLLYKNKSTNSLSLLFCILSIFSSGMWIYYSVQSSDTPMIVRSSLEISLLSISAVYIIYNKVRNYYAELRILPLWHIFRVIKKELIKLHLTSICRVAPPCIALSLFQSSYPSVISLHLGSYDAYSPSQLAIAGKRRNWIWNESKYWRCKSWVKWMARRNLRIVAPSSV